MSIKSAIGAATVLLCLIFKFCNCPSIVTHYWFRIISAYMCIVVFTSIHTNRVLLVLCYIEGIFKQHHPNSFVSICNEKNIYKPSSPITSVNSPICSANLVCLSGYLKCLFYVTNHIIYLFKKCCYVTRPYWKFQKEISWQFRFYNVYLETLQLNELHQLKSLVKVSGRMLPGYFIICFNNWYDSFFWSIHFGVLQIE